LDLVFLLLALPVVIPLSILISLAIKLTSAGPVLFKQERIGYLGKPFTVLKFRTMKVGADAGIHASHLSHLIANNAPLTKIDEMGDSRLVPFGGILRVSGLDELPQLVNVVKGEMSLIGPRPCMAYEYDKLTPYQKRRFSVLPGLTGCGRPAGRTRPRSRR